MTSKAGRIGSAIGTGLSSDSESTLSIREGKITLYEGQVWTGPGRSYWSVSLQPHGRYTQMKEFTREIAVPLWLAELAETAKGDTMAEIQFLKWLREEGILD